MRTGDERRRPDARTIFPLRETSPSKTSSTRSARHPRASYAPRHLELYRVHGLTIMNLFRRLFIVLAVGLFVVGGNAVAQETKSVLILHMESSQVPANIIASKTIEQVIGSRPKFQYFDEYLDENRLGTDYSGIAQGLQRKYVNQKMDLIITVGSQAARFLFQYGSVLWPSTPKVFCVVDGKLLPGQLPPDVTGAAGSYDFSPTVDLARQLQPDLRHVFYIGGGSPAEMGRRRMAEQEFEHFAGKLEITYLNDLPWPRLLSRLSQLPEHSAVLFTTYFKDGAGQPFITQQACRVVSATSNAPVYGTLDTVLGCGIVGGSIYSTEASARAAANLGARILNGEEISHLPVERGPANEVVVDWRQLAKWGIPVKLIPAGARIIDREPTIWQTYTKYVLGIAGLVLLQSILIIHLLLERRKRRQSDQALRVMTKRVIDASEEERRHIARELHDDFCQRLSLISFQIGSAGVESQSGDVAEQHDLDGPLRELDSLITDVHHLSHRLHSSKLEHLGLKFAMAELCRQISQKHDLQIDLRTDQLSTTPPRDISLCLYRVAQEALNNVIKHSGANSARIVLSETNGRLGMEITDSGKGFDPATVPTGLGLTAMAERVRIVDGDFKIKSRPGTGTTITTTIKILKAS
jgi:signal transduction histidine kinase